MDEAIEQAQTKAAPGVEPRPDALRENMRLLLSVLNEQQRRLYLDWNRCDSGRGETRRYPG